MTNTRMTPRQNDVLQEVYKGKSNKEIARTLNISEATVKLHMTAIFAVLGAHSRGELLARQAKAVEVNLTDEAILEEFANATFETLDAKWSCRVVNFARRVIQRTQG